MITTIEGRVIMKKIFISQITDFLTEEISEEFYLKDISLEFTKDTGISFYKLLLEDKSGRMEGRIWENNMDEDYMKFKGCVVKVYGEAIKFNGQLDFICWKMECLTEYKSSDFTPGLTDNEKEHYFKALQKQMNLIKNKGLKELLSLVFEKYGEIFCNVPANLNSHGCYNGGLLVQTVSVTSIAIQIMRSHKIYAYQTELKMLFNEDIMIAGSLLLNIGGIRVYTPFPQAEKISEYSLLTRSSLSLQIIDECFTGLTTFVSLEEKNMLCHIIQSAQPRENIKPMTREAIIVNMANTTYMRLSAMEFQLNRLEDRRGAIFVSDMNNYIYIPNTYTEGGILHDPAKLYQPGHN